jgi:hypothetical protein
MNPVKQCKKCGQSDRYASGQCKVCQQNRMAVRRAPFAKYGKPGRPHRKYETPPPAESENVEQLEPVVAPTSQSLPTPIEHPEYPPADESVVESPDLEAALTDPKKRVDFMVRRHQQSMLDMECHLRDLRGLLKWAKENRDGVAVKFYVGEIGQQIVNRANYDLKMSGEIEVWREFAASAPDATPVVLKINSFNSRDFPPKPQTPAA